MVDIRLVVRFVVAVNASNRASSFEPSSESDDGARSCSKLETDSKLSGPSPNR